MDHDLQQPYQSPAAMYKRKHRKKNIKPETLKNLPNEMLHKITQVLPKTAGIMIEVPIHELVNGNDYYIEGTGLYFNLYQEARSSRKCRGIWSFAFS